MRLGFTTKDKISLTWGVNGYYFSGNERPKGDIFAFVVFLGMKCGKLDKQNSEKLTRTKIMYNAMQ